jgi:hypothetical protein
MSKWWVMLTALLAASALPGLAIGQQCASLKYDAAGNMTDVTLASPAAPSNLLIASLGISFRLSWSDNSSKEAGFEVERATGSGAYSKIASLGANATSFTDATVTPAFSFRYRVRAYGAATCYSPYTNEVSGIQPGTAAPSNLKATASAGSQIALSWADNTGDESGFKIERKIGASGAYAQIATVGANVTSYADSTLQPGTATHVYRLAAFTVPGGATAYSNEASVLVCVPATCAGQGRNCGSLSDGCGNTLACGTCSSGNICVNGACTPNAPGPTGAAYDASLKAPLCAQLATSCDSGTLLIGRASLGPEPNAPNAIKACADGKAGKFHVDESLDRLVISSRDGTALKRGGWARVAAIVWAYVNYTSDRLEIYVASDAATPVWSLAATLSPVASGQQTLTAEFILPATAGARGQAIRGVYRSSASPTTCPTGAYDEVDDLAFQVQ